MRLLNLNSLDVLKALPNACVDLIVTDPPYRVTSRGNAGNTGGMLKKELNLKGKVFEHNDIKVSDYAYDFFRVLKDGSHCYVMTNHKHLHEMLNVFKDAGFVFTKALVWDKGNKIMGTFYMSCFEYILFFRKGKAKKINHCGTADILRIPNKKTKLQGKNIHDTEKPVALFEVLIANSSQPNDIVLDPFMGVGGAGIACKRLGRYFVGVELDKTYFDIAQQRIMEE